MVGVEQWAEIRRLQFVRGLSMREIHRQTGLHRDTISRAIHSDERPAIGARRWVEARSVQGRDPSAAGERPAIPGQRIRELIAPLGFAGGKTIVDDYLREVRPLLRPARTFQRTIYRPGVICQFDLWEPSDEIPVGQGQTRKGYVVVACLGYSRAGAGALIFCKQIRDLLFGIRRCLWSLGALSQTLVWDQQSGLHAGGGRPTAEFAAFCGALSVDWFFCEPRDPQAQGVVERLQDFLERSFEPGRRFANELDFQLQLDTWFTQRYQQAAAHTQAAGDQHHPTGEPGRGVHHAGRPSAIRSRST